MWWLLGTLLVVVGVAGVLVLGNKRQQRRATGMLTKRVKTKLAAPPKPATPALPKAPDPRVLQVCVARGCHTSKSPKKDCKCPCKGALHGMGRPGRQRKTKPAACAPAETPQPVSTRPASGPRGATITADRIEKALRSHVQSSARCAGGEVTRRTFGDGHVTYTCNTCKEVLAS